MENSGQHLSSEEKLLAGLAYLLGIIPAVIIWFWKKEDSSFVKFHALQSALFSGIVSLATAFMLAVQLALFLMMMTGAFLGTNLAADTLEPETPLVYVFITIFTLVSISVGFSVIALIVMCLYLVNTIAAVYVFSGLDWRYPLLGRWLGRVLQQEHAISKGQKND